ncbi:MAG TPA: hypothetical protein DCP28_18400 [Cytophagales bacterium]|nr:hypothetical protein [Cytophagales bacterium]
MRYPFFTALPLFILLGCSTQQQITSSGNGDISNIDYSSSYQLTDREYGTKTTMELRNGSRIMKTNALPNHPTGQFPNAGNPNRISAQNAKYTFPMEPKLTGESRWAREPGVAVNGVKLEPETAERFVCESGEVYKIEAIQELINLGLDQNLAHVQPTGAYHYHGVPQALVERLDKGEDIILIGYAKDGFPMYYSQSGRYKPSYVLSQDPRTGEICEDRNPRQSLSDSFSDTRPDGTFVSDWVYVEGHGDLDECNGITIDGEYGYLVTKEYPYVSRCLKGEFTETRPQGPPPGAHPHRPPPRGHGED